MDTEGYRPATTLSPGVADAESHNLILSDGLLCALHLISTFGVEVFDERQAERTTTILIACELGYESHGQYD